MKIQPNGSPGSGQVEQSQNAKRLDRLDIAPNQTGSRSSQVGLDRIDVSNVGETASRVMQEAGAQRSSTVSALAQLYQSGQYTTNPRQLSQTIIDHDLEPDLGASSGEFA
jgi:hypothetical protein